MVATNSSNELELERIRALAGSDEDGPVLMLNLNRYLLSAGFPDGSPYLDYMQALENLLPAVGGRLLWRRRVAGQPVGEQAIDEVLAAWYPSHQAFLDLPRAPGGRENFRLRAACLDYAVIHRCPVGAEVSQDLLV